MKYTLSISWILLSIVLSSYTSQSLSMDNAWGYSYHDGKHRSTEKILSYIQKRNQEIEKEQRGLPSSTLDLSNEQIEKQQKDVEESTFLVSQFAHLAKENSNRQLLGLFNGYVNNKLTVLLKSQFETTYASYSNQKSENILPDMLQKGFYNQLYSSEKQKNFYVSKTLPVGSTALLALIDTSNKNEPVLHLSNLGDSRAVLEFDHAEKGPYNKKVWVAYSPPTKVGDKMLPVGFGFNVKKQGTSSLNIKDHIKTVKIDLNKKNRFLILGTPGLWEVIKPEYAVMFVNYLLDNPQITKYTKIMKVKSSDQSFSTHTSGKQMVMIARMLQDIAIRGSKSTYFKYYKNATQAEIENLIKHTIPKHTMQKIYRTVEKYKDDKLYLYKNNPDSVNKLSDALYSGLVKHELKEDIKKKIEALNKEGEKKGGTDLNVGVTVIELFKRRSGRTGKVKKLNYFDNIGYGYYYTKDLKDPKTDVHIALAQPKTVGIFGLLSEADGKGTHTIESITHNFVQNLYEQHEKDKNKPVSLKNAFDKTLQTINNEIKSSQAHAFFAILEQPFNHENGVITRHLHTANFGSGKALLVTKDNRIEAVGTSNNVTTRKLDGTERFMIIGSQNFWKNINPKDIVTFTNKLLEELEEPEHKAYAALTELHSNPFKAITTALNLAIRKSNKLSRWISTLYPNYDKLKATTEPISVLFVYFDWKKTDSAQGFANQRKALLTTLNDFIAQEKKRELERFIKDEKLKQAEKKKLERTKQAAIKAQRKEEERIKQKKLAEQKKKEKRKKEIAARQFTTVYDAVSNNKGDNRQQLNSFAYAKKHLDEQGNFTLIQGVFEEKQNQRFRKNLKSSIKNLFSSKEAQQIAGDANKITKFMEKLKEGTQGLNVTVAIISKKETKKGQVHLYSTHKNRAFFIREKADGNTTLETINFDLVSPAIKQLQGNEKFLILSSKTIGEESTLIPIQSIQLKDTMTEDEKKTIQETINKIAGTAKTGNGSITVAQLVWHDPKEKKQELKRKVLKIVAESESEIETDESGTDESESEYVDIIPEEEKQVIKERKQDKPGIFQTMRTTVVNTITTAAKTVWGGMKWAINWFASLFVEREPKIILRETAGK